MDNLYSDLTGEQIMQSIKRKALLRFIGYILLMIFFIFFLGSLLKEIMQMPAQNWFFLFTMPVWILMFYFPIKGITKQLHILQTGEEHEMFRQYGSPEQIAAILCDPSSMQTINSRHYILTQTYFMRRNDFITYVPLNAVTAMRLYITHGKHASLHLKVYTYNGAEANYTIDTPLFTSLRKHKAYLADTMTELFAQYAPHIRVES